MDISITFLGAAQNVTGSRYLVQCGNLKLLVDCGIYQERELRIRNWDRFPIPPEDLEAVLLTHAHLDHCGYLPRLTREGFYGPVYCTPATSEIARISLMDAAKLLEEDAEFKRRRHEKQGKKGPHPEIPLYNTEDAELCFPLFEPVDYKKSVAIDEGVAATFYDAGHVLGSAMIKLGIRRDGQERTIIFSGDIGGWDRPIIHDPTVFTKADYVLVESTYGDKVLEGAGKVADELAEVVNSTVAAGGNIVIPSFALERTQEILYHFNKLLMANRIPHLMIFVDSPMAVNVTDVFNSHPELFDADMASLVRRNKSPFDFPGLNLVRTVDESKAINHITGNIVIIAGSGMCTGGRIKHHLVTNISRPESTILFVGYQAEGTLGRQILDGAKEVRILGEEYPVKARISQINGFSAHAHREELFRWLSGFKQAPRRVFVTHGEPKVSKSFAEALRERTGWEVSVPAYHDRFMLD